MTSFISAELLKLRRTRTGLIPLVAALVAGLGLAVTPTAAHAQPICGGATCLASERPTGTATFDQRSGDLDSDIGAVYVSGHADDPDGGPVTVDVTINGVHSASLVADQYSPTGNDVYGGYFKMPVGTPTICAVARNYGGGPSVTLGCYAAHAPVGTLEIASVNGSTATLTGWVIDPDTTGPVTLRLEAVSGTSHTYTYYTAGLFRSDIGNAYPSYGPYHGFVVSYTGPDVTCLLLDAVNIGAGVDTGVWTDCLN